MADPLLPYSHRHHADRVPGAPALTVQQLLVVYPGAERPALADISLSVPVGARVALVGHNGSGKSTLLKAVAGLLTPRQGQIRIYGLPPGSCHHRVAYLPQRSELDWRFPISLRRLVLSGRYVHLGWLRQPGRHDWALADAQIEYLGLTALAERQIGQLSGGQQQRALLARALVQEADLLLLDEPFAAVDSETQEVLRTVLASLRSQGRTLIAATHDLGRLDADFDGALYLADGRAIRTPTNGFQGIRLEWEGAWR